MWFISFQVLPDGNFFSQDRFSVLSLQYKTENFANILLINTCKKRAMLNLLKGESFLHLSVHFQLTKSDSTDFVLVTQQGFSRGPKAQNSGEKFQRLKKSLIKLFSFIKIVKKKKQWKLH